MSVCAASVYAVLFGYFIVSKLAFIYSLKYITDANPWKVVVAVTACDIIVLLGTPLYLSVIGGVMCK